MVFILRRGPGNLKINTVEATTTKTVTKSKPTAQGAGDPGHQNQKQDLDQDPH